ncbi:hypothetical protein D9619_000959 [Psilocybe cf. subviscida]|uniref:holo-[acyl-carrier-protein] synthase n=1 Tax=Psilocybe cf. subviscida TaxID=2480587 RepID=A0A8H5BD43_9AGAR|nr:hypothetical protein D9619_000959 [Psilocybe cf. subviscida]
MSSLQVWAVVYTPPSLGDDLYHRALTCVDDESQTRIKRFYHREDSCRTLIGRLLVRTMLKERGLDPQSLTFGATAAGKPYIVNQASDPPIAYNVTHDNNLIAMAVAPGKLNPPAFGVGIDIMKIRVPGRETIRSFINTVGDQLTPLEHYLLKLATSDEERTKIFFWMWTLKEAYTKALGIGLGFDFRRIEFDVANKIVRVDKRIPPGWRFDMFEITDGDDLYEGVVAEYLGEGETMVTMHNTPEWLMVSDAATFTENAINTLHS